MKERARRKKVVRISAQKYVASEAELVGILRAPLDRGIEPKTLLLENGHDAAVLSGFTRGGLAATVDRIVEDVHFRSRWSDARSVAAKVFASNVSDLVAVGAEPTFGLLSLTFSAARLSVADVRALATAFAAEARRYRMRVVGGNVTRARGPFTADLAALGNVAATPFRRDALRPGSVILVVGRHGEAAAGLACLERYRTAARVPKAFRSLVRAQLYPRIRLDVLDALTKATAPLAAMDTSDGLGATLATMAQMSGCAVNVDTTALVPSVALRKAAETLGEAVERWVFFGGEDYGLVVGVAPTDVDVVVRALIERRVPVAILGRATRGRGVRGLPKNAVGGWDPFRS